MGLARNLSKFKPNSDGLVEANDLGFALSSSSLSQSFPLKSGTSVTAGKVVSVNGSGEVGSLPVVNALGTEQANSTSGISYTAYSTDATRAINCVFSYSETGSQVIQLQTRGYAINSSGVVTNGSTFYTTTFSVSGSYVYAPSWDIYTIPLNSTTIAVCWRVRVQSAGSDSNCNGYDYRNARVRVFVVSVDSSGNVTNTSSGFQEITDSTSATNTNATNVSSEASAITAVNAFSGTVYRAGPSNAQPRTFVVTTTSVTVTTDAETWVNVGTPQSLLTSNNIVVAPSGTSVSTGTYSSGNFGTRTSTTVITDNRTSDLVWTVIDSTKVMCAYNNSDNINVVRTFSVNQTTGALTSTNVYITDFGRIIAWKMNSSTEGTFVYETASTYYINSFTLNSSGVFNGFNVPIFVGAAAPIIVRNSSSLYFASYYSNSFQRLRPFTVNSYATDVFSFIGVAPTTTSSSPVSIVVGGVASSFSGLTPNTNYYVDASFNGNITTSSISGILVGKSISATEILLGAST